MTRIASHHCTDCVCLIAPPDLIARLAQEGTKEQRDAALQTIASSASFRARRALLTDLVQKPETREAALAFIAPAPAAAVKRKVYDAHNLGGIELPGELKRSEGDPPAADDAVNEAYDNAGVTYDFYE